MSTVLGAIQTTVALYTAAEVDALVAAAVAAATSNLDIKDGVATVATANITLSGEQTINGVLTSASRVGVVGQTAGAENGIYTTAAGAWVRTSDADVSAEVSNGFSFFVSGSASTLSGNQYLLITADPITLGTTALVFTMIPRVPVASAGETAAATSAAVAISPSTLSSITTLGTIETGVWQGTPVGLAYGGTGAATAAGARTNLGLGTFAVVNIAAVPTITMIEGGNIAAGTVTGTKFGTSATEKISFFGVTPVVQSAAYTVTNALTDRTLDANATTIDELADFVATMYADLKALGALG